MKSAIVKKRTLTAFQLADIPGVTIEFKRDAQGTVTEAALNQLGTVIVLKKQP